MVGGPTNLVAYAIASCAVFLFSCSNATKQIVSNDQGVCDDERLYDTLRSLASADDFFLTRTHCEPLEDGRALAWVSTDSPTGEAIIGVFDSELHLVNWRRTDPLTQGSAFQHRGLGQLICFIEQATGTGQRIETLHVVRAKNLVEDLWSGVVSSWEDGVEGRNIGHKIDHCLVMMDVNRDGVDEIVGFGFTRKGTDMATMLLSCPTSTQSTYFYDKTIGRFRVDDTSFLPKLYPSHDSDNDSEAGPSLLSAR